jgi:hypothetical protein
MASTPIGGPAGGPYFGKLDPAASYSATIDNTGDGSEDVSYRWQFSNRYRNPSSFLYELTPINSLDTRTRPNDTVAVNTVPNAQWHDAIFT